MTDHTGKCHCGQTEWEVTIQEDMHILCHCDTCKILAGGAFSMFQYAKKDALRVTKGRLASYTYIGDSGNELHTWFCPNCATPAYNQPTIPGVDVITVKTPPLDGFKDFPLKYEFRGKDRMHWEKEAARTFRTIPRDEVQDS